MPRKLDLKRGRTAKARRQSAVSQFYEVASSLGLGG